MDLKQKINLFATAFIQVFLVSANTYFISKTFYIGIAFAGYGISWFWTGNVKKVSFGKVQERVIYSLGATIGGLSGVLLSKIIFKL